MPMYHICPDCGSHLDPGEKCDCQKAQAKEINTENKEEKKTA